MHKQFGPTQVSFEDQLPSKRKIENDFGESRILIYDRILQKNSKISKWLKNFPRRYAVRSGEKLKNIEGISLHLKEIVDLSKGLPTAQVTIVVLGGGSVGDFGGFIASVLKRGVRLVHIPSTWLAAIDSAHGGKTALNVGRAKNQIGTFYPATSVHLIREVLMNQPEARSFEALGEVFKTGLIGGGKLWQQLAKMKGLESTLFWQLLLPMVKVKYAVVKKDPFEKKGTRHILNLGHTVGHVLESRLKIPHGIAVLYGLQFSLEWSFHRGYMTSKNYFDIRLSGIGSYLPDQFQFKKLASRIGQIDKLLLQDKKMSEAKVINFIFIEKPGQTRIEKVKVKDILKELKRQVR